MARRTIVQVFDDLDGTQVAEADARTRTLIVDGVAYEWEVGPSGAALLDAALAPLLAKAVRLADAPPPPRKVPVPEAAPVVVPTVAAEALAEAPAPAAEPLPVAVAVAEPAAKRDEFAPPKKAASKPKGPVPLRNCQEAQLFYFGEVTVPREVCAWPGAADARSQKGHLRLSHGIGGISAAEMNRNWRADEAAKKAARLEASATTAKLRQQIADRGGAKVPPPPVLPKDPPAGLKKVTVTKLTPAVHTIVPGVNIITADQQQKAQPGTGMLLSPERPVVRPFGERTEEVSLKATELAKRWEKGMPEHVAFQYHPDVLALHGMDKELMEAAVRNPEWVEIAPDTFTKGYTVLRFHRGDAQAVIGCRDVNRPMMIAAYHGSLLEHDVHRVNHTGGGGAKRRVPSGLPKTPRQAIQYLTAAGAQVEWDESKDAGSVPVTFAGQDLGKITVGAVPRSQVETDYQRTLRKIAAIKLRGEQEKAG